MLRFVFGSPGRNAEPRKSGCAAHAVNARCVGVLLLNAAEQRMSSPRTIRLRAGRDVAGRACTAPLSIYRERAGERREQGSKGEAQDYWTTLGRRDRRPLWRRSSSQGIFDVTAAVTRVKERPGFQTPEPRKRLRVTPSNACCVGALLLLRGRTPCLRSEVTKRFSSAMIFSS